ncbi:hypothetical protein D9757_003044 [Collybiopsis confluens]|uniref:Uncharacterized protein n=1 Tax=Collybiopsis confluens TaxID=2823264 RepID=A0A8H5HX89_9AGAR|nr:hypothetical protein D9757_003044 [Collybiopsis confluens]
MVTLTPVTIPDAQGIKKIKAAVLDTMKILDIDPKKLLPFETTPTFQPFVAECVEEARKRGYLGEGNDNAFKEKHVHIGAAVGHYTYLHHKNTPSHDLAVLSSLLMAFYYCVDDYCFEAESVAGYGSRLASGQSQLEKGLDDLVSVSAELELTGIQSG